MKSLSLRSLLPLFFVLIGAAGFALLLMTKPRAVPIEPSEKAWLIAVEPVRVQTLAPELALYGRVESPRSATLTAALNADVIDVPVLEGLQVKQGQLLVHLDDRDSRLQLNQREAELAEIESEIESENHRYRMDLKTLDNEKALLQLAGKAVKRMQSLKKTQVASESGLEEAMQAMEQQAISVKARELAIGDHNARLTRLEARRDRARALRDLAQLELERTRIVAPFAGCIASVPVSVGDRVRSGDALIELYDTLALEVRAQVPARYLDTIYRALSDHKPLTAQSTVDGGQVSFRLDRLAGQVSAGSGGVDALFRVTRGHKRLRLGRFVSLTLHLLAEAEVIALPYEALYGSDRVYTLVDGRMKALHVEPIGEWTAPDASVRVLVRTGELQEGDMLIITQLPNAIDGLLVTAQKPSV